MRRAFGSDVQAPPSLQLQQQQLAQAFGEGFMTLREVLGAMNATIGGLIGAVHAAAERSAKVDMTLEELMLKAGYGESLNQNPVETTAELPMPSVVEKTIEERPSVIQDPVEITVELPKPSVVDDEGLLLQDMRELPKPSVVEKTIEVEQKVDDGFLVDLTLPHFVNDQEPVTGTDVHEEVDDDVDDEIDMELEPDLNPNEPLCEVNIVRVTGDGERETLSEEIWRIKLLPDEASFAEFVRRTVHGAVHIDAHMVRFCLALVRRVGMKHFIQSIWHTSGDVRRKYPNVIIIARSFMSSVTKACEYAATHHEQECLEFVADEYATIELLRSCMEPICEVVCAPSHSDQEQSDTETEHSELTLKSNEQMVDMPSEIEQGGDAEVVTVEQLRSTARPGETEEDLVEIAWLLNASKAAKSKPHRPREK